MWDCDFDQLGGRAEPHRWAASVPLIGNRHNSAIGSFTWFANVESTLLKFGESAAYFTIPVVSVRSTPKRDYALRWGGAGLLQISETFFLTSRRRAPPNGPRGTI
jgi:hypothetical protein